MHLASVRLVTDDVDRLSSFYQSVTGLEPARPAPVFVQFDGPGVALALADRSTVAMLGDAAAPGSVASVLVEFEVDSADAVDAEFDRLRTVLEDVVLPPTTMPWGNRSMVFRDPDGHVVNVFARPAGEVRPRGLRRSPGGGTSSRRGRARGSR